MICDPSAIPVAFHRLAQADPDLRVVAACVQDDPRLGLPERRREGITREGATGVDVHRQPLGGVEQLREHAGRGAETGDVRVAEPPDRIGLHRIAEDAAPGEAREPLGGIVPPRVSCSGHGAEPVLRAEAVLLRRTPQSSQEGSAPVEAMDAGRFQPQWTHDRSIRF